VWVAALSLIIPPRFAVEYLSLAIKSTGVGHFGSKFEAEWKDGALATLSGRLFHVRGAAMAMFRSPRWTRKPDRTESAQILMPHLHLTQQKRSGWWQKLFVDCRLRVDEYFKDPAPASFCPFITAGVAESMRDSIAVTQHCSLYCRPTPGRCRDDISQRKECSRHNHSKSDPSCALRRSMAIGSDRPISQRIVVVGYTKPMVSDSLRQSSLLSTIVCLQCMADQDVIIRLSLSTHRDDIYVVLTVVIRLTDVKK